MTKERGGPFSESLSVCRQLAEKETFLRSPCLISHSLFLHLLVSVVTQRVQVLHVAAAVIFALSKLLIQEGIVRVHIVMSVCAQE